MPSLNSRPTSLLLTTSSYLPIIGGSEIEAQRVCAALQERGHEVLILCPGGPPMPSTQRWTDPRGIRVRSFGNRFPIRLRGYAFALGVVLTLLRRVRHYELAYFLMPGLQVALGVPTAALLGKQIVMKFSGSNEIRKLTQSVIGRLQLRALRQWADRIMILNPMMTEEAVESGLERNKLMWMPNPVDVEEFSPLAGGKRTELRRSLGWAGDDRVILFVGRLAPEKELASLVQGFARVAAERPNARLVLVGDGPCRVSLEDLARQLGVDSRVMFSGQKDPTTVCGFLQCADVFTLVSSLEGFPVSLVEAMATALPVVVSDISANLQLVENEQNGLVAGLREDRSIATALQRLLEDAELRVRMGAAARESIVNRYSTARVVELYETLFTELRQ